MELRLQSQTWITLVTKRHGLVMIEPIFKVHKTNAANVGNAVTQVAPDVPLHMLVSKFSIAPVLFFKKKSLDTLCLNPE